MFKEISSQDLVFQKKIQGLCRKPYYKHSKGCPNFGKKETCPPNLPLLDEVFDFKERVFLIYTAFPIGEFAEKMRQNHPKWEGQVRNWYNPRRWQGTARKERNLEIKKFLTEFPDFLVTTSPEAFGLDCTDAMKKIGITLDWNWPPEHELEGEAYKKNLSYLIALAGIKKETFERVELLIGKV